MVIFQTNLTVHVPVKNVQRDYYKLIERKDHYVIIKQLNIQSLTAVATINLIHIPITKDMGE